MSEIKFPHGLYGISPDWDDTDKLLLAIEQAHAGGMRAFQLRRKNVNTAELLAQAKEIGAICAALNIVFIINDNYEIAAQINADGVHLGKDDAAIEKARHALGPHKIIGKSCYNQLDLAANAIQQGANYVAFGAVFPSQIKPNAPRASLELLHTARQTINSLKTNTAIVAIGGITPQNASDLVTAGVDSLAVISSVFMANNIEQSAKAFSDLYTN